ncbi:MAG: hypothetical protein JST26_20660, partial [Bacteroidetes bacterium]|nr:hypothetical protein [Bacteroidota bacterium]
AEAEAKAKAEAEAKKKAEEEAAKKNINNGKNETSLPVLGGADVKYKNAVKLGDDNMRMKRYLDAKKNYEEALTYKAGDSYCKNKLIEIEKLIKGDDAVKVDERLKNLLAKYPPGVTEETINGSGVVIIQRVVVKDTMAWVYQKKIFSWGGVSYFRDSTPITESTFEQETKP